MFLETTQACQFSSTQYTVVSFPAARNTRSVSMGLIPSPTQHSISFHGSHSQPHATLDQFPWVSFPAARNTRSISMGLIPSRTQHSINFHGSHSQPHTILNQFPWVSFPAARNTRSVSTGLIPSRTQHSISFHGIGVGSKFAPHNIHDNPHRPLTSDDVYPQ